MRLDQNLDATFAALADPTRRAILARLASGEATVTELVKPFTMSQPAISKHLKVLERAGLISRGQDAQRRPRSGWWATGNSGKAVLSVWTFCWMR
jgi:DNA-binding transcriptional ArsR family regulator